MLGSYFVVHVGEVVKPSWCPLPIGLSLYYGTAWARTSLCQLSSQAVVARLGSCTGTLVASRAPSRLQALAVPVALRGSAMPPMFDTLLGGRVRSREHDGTGSDELTESGEKIA